MLFSVTIPIVRYFSRVQQEKKKEMQNIVCIHFKQGRCIFGDKCLKYHGNPTKKVEYSTPVTVAAAPPEPKKSETPVETVESLMKQKNSKKVKRHKASKKVEPSHKAGEAKHDPSSNSKLENGENVGCDTGENGYEEGEQIDHVGEVVEEER